MRGNRSWDRLVHGVVPPERVPAPLRMRRGRRALVLLLALSWAATVAAALPGMRSVVPGAWVAPLTLTVALLLLLTLATRNVTGARDAYSDERERAVRDRAHRLAYWMLAFPLGMLCGLLFGRFRAAVDAGRVVVLTTAQMPTVMLLLGTFAVLFFSLPPAIVAWTEPDPPEDLPETY